MKLYEMALPFVLAEYIVTVLFCFGTQTMLCIHVERKQVDVLHLALSVLLM